MIAPWCVRMRGQFEIKCLLLDLLAGPQVDSSQSSSTRPLSTSVQFSSDLACSDLARSAIMEENRKALQSRPKTFVGLAKCFSVQRQKFGISPVILLCANWSVAGPYIYPLENIWPKQSACRPIRGTEIGLEHLSAHQM